MAKPQFIRLFILLLIVSLGGYLFVNEFSHFFQNGILVLMGALTILWLVSLMIKDASIIDIFWGSGFVIVAWYYASQIGFDLLSMSNKLFLALISIWGLRLTIYLGWRNIGKPEDFRYAKWRADNGKNWWWLSFIRVFALQGFLLWIISSVFVPALLGGNEIGILEIIGTILWAIGIFFEAVGDWQLSQFKKDPKNKGKVMDRGLWKYTRHPNYFGDSMIWFGFFFFGLTHSSGMIYIFCPIIMTLFLVKISGVAMLESTLKKTKPTKPHQAVQINHHKKSTLRKTKEVAVKRMKRRR